jgi:hypothetical protein
MRGINGSGTTYSSSGTRKRTIILMDLSRNMISPESANTDKKIDAFIPRIALFCQWIIFRGFIRYGAQRAIKIPSKPHHS